MGRVQDRVVIVTGGAGGIGAAACQAIAAEGGKVVVAEVLDEAADFVGIHVFDGSFAEEIEEAHPIGPDFRGLQDAFRELVGIDWISQYTNKVATATF